VSPLLRTSGLSVAFGGVQALIDVDVTVGEDELVGLIGPNGAGKTTFIDAVTGFVPSAGRVEFSGRDISGLSAHRRARRGITRTFQSLELFDDLTIAENVAAPLERSVGPEPAARPGATAVDPSRHRRR
jgi:ABC-type branched-subunit amino acid transport system ATPase component